MCKRPRVQVGKAYPSLYAAMGWTATWVQKGVAEEVLKGESLTRVSLEQPFQEITAAFRQRWTFWKLDHMGMTQGYALHLNTYSAQLNAATSPLSIP